MPELTLNFAGGLNNQARETKLPENSLRVCDNLDITREGTAVTRRGTRLVSSGVTHSFYPHPHGYYALFVNDNALQRLDPDGTITPLRALSNTARVSYTHLNGAVFWSNGADVGQITAAGAYTHWGLPTPPTPTPTVAVGAGGLPAGEYQVTWTARVNGLESGAPYPATLVLAESDGVTITAPVSAGVEFVVYLSTADSGEASLRQAAVAPSGATLTLGVGFPGKMCEMLGAVKPLPGQLVSTYRGRLFVASGSVVWFTTELSPHWLIPHLGQYRFDAPVDLLAPAEDGLYIAAGKRTFFLQGRNPLDATLRPVLPYGAVRYTQQADIPYDLFLGEGVFPSQSSAWVDSEGSICLGRPGGLVQRITAKRYLADAGETGALAIHHREGLRQFVVSMQGLESSANTATAVPINTIFSHSVTLSAEALYTYSNYTVIDSGGQNYVTSDTENYTVRD